MAWWLSRINKGALLSTAKLSLLLFYRYSRSKKAMPAAGT